MQPKSEKLGIKSCYLETLLLPPCIPEAFCQECFVRSSPKRLPLLGPHRSLKGVLFAPSQTIGFWTPDGTCPLSSLCHSQTIFLPASLKLMPLLYPPGCWPSVTDNFTSWTQASFSLLLLPASVVLQSSHKWFIQILSPTLSYSHPLKCRQYSN